LISTRPSYLSIEETVGYTNRVIAEGASEPLLLSWSPEQTHGSVDPASSLKMPANIRTERASSPAAAVTLAAIVADGIVLGVYHSRKRRSRRSVFSDAVVTA
jgi:hypothetical protein